MIKFWKFRNRFKIPKFNSKIRLVSMSMQKLWSILTPFQRMAARKICLSKVPWLQEIGPIDQEDFRLLTLQE